MQSVMMMVSINYVVDLAYTGPIYSSAAMFYITALTLLSVAEFSLEE